MPTSGWFFLWHSGNGKSPWFFSWYVNSRNWWENLQDTNVYAGSRHVDILWFPGQISLKQIAKILCIIQHHKQWFIAAKSKKNDHPNYRSTIFIHFQSSFIWLVVSTPLKNMSSSIESIGMMFQTTSNHQPVLAFSSAALKDQRWRSTFRRILGGLALHGGLHFGGGGSGSCERHGAKGAIGIWIW